MYHYKPRRISDLWNLLLHEREEEAKRMRLENCLNYTADLLWTLVTGTKFNKGVLKPYTVLMQNVQKHKDEPQENDDFFAILKNRVENRKKGGDHA